MTVATVVTRFAPSPNGELHLGHALSAITGYEWARRRGGRFLVRIEDIDLARSREAHVAAIRTDLEWLGLDWERPELRQSEHFVDYKAAAARLAALGLLYPCFATRAEIAVAAKARPEAVDPDGAPLYPGLSKGLPGEEAARRIAAGEPHALRIDMARALAHATEMLDGLPLTFTELDAAENPSRTRAKPELWGDAIIVRKDVPASYHLAVVLDDARQGVTHVTRGMDLYPATHLHRLLQVLLGLPEPLYHHHRLITDHDGRKLAKSLRDTSLRQLREAGATAAEVRRSIGAI